ncbi:MAG: hypothetical protein AAF655_09305 [Bacteroidota bacterium]
MPITFNIEDNSFYMEGMEKGRVLFQEGVDMLTISKAARLPLNQIEEILKESA